MQTKSLILIYSGTTSRNQPTVEQDGGSLREACNKTPCVHRFQWNIYVCRRSAAGAVGGSARDKQTSLTRHKREGERAGYMLPLYTSNNTQAHTQTNEHRQANTCMHERTYVFSRRVVYPLGLVTDLHEMVQLVKKLLTGTMDLDTTPAQHRSAKGSLMSSRTSRVYRGIFLFYCVVCRRECVSSSCR